jgi:hypothetical protein
MCLVCVVHFLAMLVHESSIVHSGNAFVSAMMCVVRIPIVELSVYVFEF